MKSRPLTHIRQLLEVPAGNTKLLEAQYRALARQLPLMYLVLLINTWALAATHLYIAPAWLTLGAPIVMTLVSVLRMVRWWGQANVVPPADEIVTALKRTNSLAIVVAGIFTAWSLSLFPYGGAYDKAHVAFYMSITVIVCIFCLMHLRPAALTATLVVNVAFIVFFASTGIPTFVATALNIFLVSVAMLIVLDNQYRDFTRLIDMQVHAEELSEQNLELANRDSLTGLPNRRHFFSRLNAIIDAADADSAPLVAVGVLDLDGFKGINDLYGHSAGDSLLAAVGGRLKPLASDTVLLARLGGDEFAFLVTKVGAKSDLADLARQMLSELQAAFNVLGTTVQVGATIGIATFPDTAFNSAELYEHADYALYQGKRQQPGSYCFFSDVHREQLKRDASIEHALRKADLGEELHMVYQPIVNCDSGETVAFEALARWRSPTLGDVPPGQFIPVAERTGLIGRLTLPLLAQALDVAQNWPAPVRLSFNLSAHDVGSMEHVMRIVNMVASSGFPPDRIDFEITETAIMLDLDQVQRAVQEFGKLGCGVSLDDFGTGYSSLSQLHALALTKLKVDRSFVTDIHLKPSSCKIVKSLVKLAEDMDFGCIIEGVETQEELHMLKTLGCQHVQGYLFSRPLSAEQTEAWIARNADVG
ncbi:putative bifunctional diguanylate cyclase/phosphodiesterase [Pseudomonas matsuisoli]|uniref:Diguanylate cyclase n=1 Tax=Pseudomonas matsuisoli TaxID=1515666 RepID=A0A917PNS7_9PSED|nr:EAL domain-containing protein [Pseudomonas matsuisoli]GGJ86329.1 diguanylate cyclase [Pseudomonas matsuisoli]